MQGKTNRKEEAEELPVPLFPRLLCPLCPYGNHTGARPGAATGVSSPVIRSSTAIPGCAAGSANRTYWNSSRRPSGDQTGGP